MECLQYEKFPSFCNSILHTGAPALHCCNSVLIAKVQGRQSYSIRSNRNTVITEILYVGYGCTEACPNVSNMCQVKFGLERVKASLFGTVSVFHISEVNTH